MTTLQDKFQTLRTALQACLIERDAEIDACLIALVAREHIWLCGEPGTGKSLLLRSVCQAIDGGEFFENLMMKDTSRDEIIGYIDMEKMANERKWSRDYTNMMPRAHFVFLDEFTRSSSYIANSLLRAVNEREILDMGKRVAVPLMTSVVATNNWPTGDGYQEWGAIFDRFLIRRMVKSVSKQNQRKLRHATLTPVPKCLTLADVEQAIDEASKLPYSEAALVSEDQIYEELRNAGIRIGDRRSRAACKVARAAAWLDGSAEVEPKHLEALIDVLWEDPVEQPTKAAEIICRIANPIGARLQEILRDVDAVLADVGDDQGKRMAALKKLEVSQKELKKLLKEGNGRAKKAHEYVKKERFLLGAVIQGIDKATAEKNYAILCPAD